MSKKRGEEVGAMVGIIIACMFAAVFTMNLFTGYDNTSTPSTKTRSYGDVPPDMSRSDSNYIGNTAKEHGLNEQEAIQVRDAINKFNRAQENR